MQTNRVKIIHNGVEIMAVSCLHERPTNGEDLINLLKDLIQVLESPVVEDKEIF